MTMSGTARLARSGDTGTRNARRVAPRNGRATAAATPPDLTNPLAAARAAGLRYVADTAPGIRRSRAARGFRYTGPDGQPVRERAELARIRALAIPPAWTAVWICPNPRGHIQATGRDARGRKQYRYHPLWRAIRDETKYHRLIAFGETLPTIRRRVAEDLARACLSRANVLATVARLLDETSIRIGNEEYARENDSYGLTTLRNEHVEIDGPVMRFSFRGKSGKEHSVEVRDRRLARLVRRCQELPGHELFQYIGPDGESHSIESNDVNEYLRQLSGQDFTAKDYRTWTGTVTAAHALEEIGPAETLTAAKRNITEAVKAAARELGNTPAVCRKSYVHPGIYDAYLDATLFERRGLQGVETTHDSPYGLRPEEADVLALLRSLDATARQETVGQRRAG